jgi:hypothetical protein
MTPHEWGTRMVVEGTPGMATVVEAEGPIYSS